MANNNRAPKQWQLSPSETLNTFKNWKENLVHTLSLDSSFKPFLKNDVTWEKHTSASPNRGFVDDDTTATNAKTKEEKVTTLNLMLGQIANYATVISRNQIVKSSTSLSDIWNKIRQHYGFHTTGSRFLDLTNIRPSSGDSPEALYQTLVSFMDDNLLTTDCSLTHHSAKVEKDEEMSPTLENMVVLLWLERLHVNLPSLIKQRYGAELRNKTLASIKPEISQALSSLLEELSVGEDSRISRSQASFSNRRGGGNSSSFNTNNSRQSKFCCLCRSANRPGFDTHFLSQCRFLPESDRKRMSQSSSSKIRSVEAYDNDNYDSFDYEHSGEQDYPLDHEQDYRYNPQQNQLYDRDPSSSQQISHPIVHRRVPSLASVHRRVTTSKSPMMLCFYRHIPISVCLDTGAETNLICESIAKSMNLKYSKTDQGAVQADEKTPLTVIGEISGIKLNKGAFVFNLDALVVKGDLSYIVAGEPFLEENDIAIRPAKRLIIIQGRENIPYASAQ